MTITSSTASPIVPTARVDPYALRLLVRSPFWWRRGQPQTQNHEHASRSCNSGSAASREVDFGDGGTEFKYGIRGFSRFARGVEIALRFSPRRCAPLWIVPARA